MGFFQRRAESRQESQAKTQAFEAMAQFAARDMAVPVLWVCRQSGENPRSMQSVVPVIMNDDAPRALVGRGIGRAAQIADEIRQTFGDDYAEAERALFAAYDDDVEDDAAPEIYAKLATLAALSEYERKVVIDAGAARGDERDPLTDSWHEYWKVSMDAAPGMTSMEINLVIQKHGLQSLDLRNPPELLVAAWNANDDKSDPRSFILSWLRADQNN